MTFLQDITPIAAEQPAIPFSSFLSVMPCMAKKGFSAWLWEAVFFLVSRAVGLATASIWNDIINKVCGVQAISPGFTIQPTREWTGMCKSKDKKGEEGESESVKNSVFVDAFWSVYKEMFF